MSDQESNSLVGGKYCETRLLSDDPSDEDAFGSHERVARAVASLVDKERGGKSIALTGPYGSGKSTVVNLLDSVPPEGRANSEIKRHVFVFDASAHQGDPLRRSFLEELIGSLVDRGWTRDEKWKEDIEKISRRREDSDTSSTPILTKPGKWLAGTLLFLPLGYTLFRTLDSGSSDPGLSFFGLFPLWIIGLILVVSPILVALKVWICWRPTFKVWKREFWKENRAPHEDESILTLFVRRTQEVSKSTTVRTPDPTTIEFREVFSRTLNGVLNDKKRRLVVVVDNLDRVPAQEALSVWSTMRAFFEPNNNIDPCVMERFWLLVPVDSMALRRLWNSEVEGNGDLAKSFMDKTFQVTFHVPPPVLTSWKRFMEKQLSKAFPNHSSEDDFGTVYRLYSRDILPDEGPLTPRDIKLFINRVGALHRQWEDAIPLPLQGLYALYEKEIAKDPETKLKDGSLITQRVLNILGRSEWQKYLAALHYNVEPEVAIQVMIGNSVAQALTSGESKKLEAFRDVPGFVEVCERTVEENYGDWTANDPNSLALASLAIDGIKDESIEDWTRVWQWLGRGASQVNHWENLDDEIGQGIVAVMQHRRTADQADLDKIILTSVSSLDEDDEEAMDHQLWLKGVLHIVEFLHEDGRHELLEQHFRVPGQATFYIEVIKALGEASTSKRLQGYFLAHVESEAIEKELQRRCEKGELEESDTEAIRLTNDIYQNHGDWTWENLAASLEKRLQSAQELETQEIRANLRALLSLTYDAGLPNVKQKVQQLCSRGYLMHHLHKAQTSRDVEAVALCLLPIIDFYPQGMPQANHQNSQAGFQQYSAILQNPEGHENVVDELSRHIAEFDRLEAVLKQSHNAANIKALIRATVRQISESEEAHLHIRSRLLIEYYDFIEEAISEEALEQLIEKLARDDLLLHELRGQEFSPKIAGLYLHSLQRLEENDNYEGYVNFLITGLHEISKELWLDALRRVMQNYSNQQIG